MQFVELLDSIRVSNDDMASLPALLATGTLGHFYSSPSVMHALIWDHVRSMYEHDAELVG